MPNSKSSQNVTSPILVLFVIFTFGMMIALALYAGANLQANNLFPIQLSAQRKVLPFQPNCPQVGIQPLEGYLTNYTVKPGDTLLSVAKKMLGDSGRANELAKINNDSYPELSIAKPFLEQGWLLKLPPKDFKTNGILIAASGRVGKSDRGWGISWTNSSVGPFQLNELPATIQNNDCVTVLYEGSDLNYGNEPKVLNVMKQ